MSEPGSDIGIRDEDVYALDGQQVAAIVAAAMAGDQAELFALLEPLHAADIADLLEQISADERAQDLDLWRGGVDGELLSELDEGLREEVIRTLGPDQLADALKDLESDDVVDLVEDLDEPQQEVILEALEDADRIVVEQALSYPEDSAGPPDAARGRHGPEHWTVGEAIDYLRAHDDLPETVLSHDSGRSEDAPRGYVTLGGCWAHRGTKLADIAEDSFRTIPVGQDEEEVAYAFNQYHLISAPVVDEEDGWWA